MKDNMTQRDYEMQMLLDGKSRMEVDEILGGMENNKKLFSQKEITKIAISQCKGCDKPSSKIWNDAIHAVLMAIKKEANNG